MLRPAVCFISSPAKCWVVPTPALPKLNFPGLARTAESIAPDDRDRFVFDARQPGFAIRITPSGTKIFTVQGYVNGRKRRVTVGYHPNVSVAQARELALQALADMRRGNDPIIER